LGQLGCDRQGEISPTKTLPPTAHRLSKTVGLVQ
jgi:hypothetical protein